MARIPRDLIDRLTYQLNTLSEAAQRVVVDILESIDYTDTADLREQLINLLEPIFGAATDDAAAFAAQLYDEIREYQLGKRLGAVAESGRVPAATENSIRAFMSYLENGGILRIAELLKERIDYEIKKAASQCILTNAERDPAEVRFARVPTGADTCEFCIMLASRGFVYRSEASAGAFDHFHARCDCRVVPGFVGETQIPGYDPDALYEQWKESGFMPNSSGSGRISSNSIYRYKGKDNEPSFSNFNDVKEWLYEATTPEDLESKYHLLLKIYGRTSKAITSQRLKDVFKTANKRIRQKHRN